MGDIMKRVDRTEELKKLDETAFGVFKHPKKGRFLAHLATLGTVRAAAEATGINFSTPYVWKQQDPEFAEAMETAQEQFTQRLEEAAYRKAIDKDDTTMQIFLLKAQRPEKYRDRVDLNMTGNVGFEFHSCLPLPGAEEAETD